MHAFVRLPLLLAALPIARLVAQSGSPTPVLPDTIPWVAVSHTPGAHTRWLVGRAQKTGVYAFQVRFEAGTKAAPHTHPDERYTLVLSGTWYVGFGEVFDEAKLVAVPAGAVYVAPARVPHFMWAKNGEVVIQESGTNPTATDFVQRPPLGTRPAPR